MYNNSINQTYRYLLQTKEGKGFSEAEIKIILPQILSALNLLHSQNQSHGAISLETIVNQNNQLILLPNQNYNFDPQKDIYDLGLVLIELLTAKSPHEILNLTTGETWDDYCFISDNLIALINKMIAPFPERFNSVNEILMSLNNQNNAYNPPPVSIPNSNPTLISQPNIYQPNNSQTVVSQPNYVQPQPNYQKPNYDNQINQVQRKKIQKITVWLVPLFIIGILGVIALPGFLNQANKARQAEAKMSISALVRSQVQSYIEEGNFKNNLSSLGTGLNSETDNYSYEVKLLNENSSIISATPKKKGINSYLGVTFISNSNIIYGICGTKEPSLIAPQTPELTDINFQCSNDSELFFNPDPIPVPTQFLANKNENRQSSQPEDNICSQITCWYQDLIPVGEYSYYEKDLRKQVSYIRKGNLMIGALYEKSQPQTFTCFQATIGNNTINVEWKNNLWQINKSGQQYNISYSIRNFTVGNSRPFTQGLNNSSAVQQCQN
jgi:type IV pilus assembly protein PilA